MRILLATDGSEHSQAAVTNVLTRPWPSGSSVLVLSVVATPFPMVDPSPAAGAIQYEALSRSMTEATRALVARTADALKDTIPVETSVRMGDARVEIVQAADDWGADLIVVGSHGRTGMSRWLLGSVAEYVVRHASCSVEVARKRQR
jgi:nucleotide-binding universal stress UspA family protein